MDLQSKSKPRYSKFIFDYRGTASLRKFNLQNLQSWINKLKIFELYTNHDFYNIST